MQVRNLRETDDLKVLAKLYFSNVLDINKGKIVLDEDSIQSWKDTIHQYADLFLLIDQEIVIGFASIGKTTDDNCGLIKHIYFDKKFKNQNLERLLLGTLLNELDERGYECACLWIDKNDQANRAVFEEYGFELLPQERIETIHDLQIAMVEYRFNLETESNFM